MEFIKEWTLTVCVTLIISVIFSLLTPKGSMGKYFKIVLAVFIFLSFIYPFKNAEIDLAIPEFNSQAYETQQRDAYEKTVNESVANALKQGGYGSCTADCEIDMDGRDIYIRKLTVYAPSEYDTNQIKDYLFDSLGINAEVYHFGE